MIDHILLYGVLILMLAAAVLTVITDRLFTAVIYAGVLSAIAAFCYLLLGAPDVALAEAVIGSTLSTVILLATLRKYRIFTIYLNIPEPAGDTARRVLAALEHALQQQDIEPHVLHTTEPPAALLTQPGCDLVMHTAQDGQLVLHVEQGSQSLARIRAELDRAGLTDAVAFADSLQSRVAGRQEGGI